MIMQQTRSRERPAAPPLRRLAHRLLATVLSASLVLDGALPVRAQTTTGVVASDTSTAMPAAAPAPVVESAPSTAPAAAPPAGDTTDAAATDTAASSLATTTETTSPATTTTVVASVDDPETKPTKEPDPAPFSGSYTRRIDLALPAFHDLTPALAAYYDSNAGWHAGELDAGFLGVGWRLQGFSEIVRSGSHGGSPLFDASAVLASKDVYRLDGVELHPCVSGGTSASCTTGTTQVGNFEPRYETDERVRYDAGTDSWTVWKKTGTRSVYRPVSTWGPGTGTVPADIAEDRKSVV
jgi:hypothetical protein